MCVCLVLLFLFFFVFFWCRGGEGATDMVDETVDGGAAVESVRVVQPRRVHVENEAVPGA